MSDYLANCEISFYYIFHNIILTSRNSVDHFFRITEEMRFKVPDQTKYFCQSEAVAYYLQKYVVYRKRKIYVGNNNFKDLESLPGVGHKTASVVMSQGFGIPAFAVDTHIHRLAQRWGLTNGSNVATTERDLKKIFPKDSWNKLHLQIIFWGREFCTARSCYRLECKIRKTCYPNRKKPIKTKKA